MAADLTPREQEVAALLAEGKYRYQIAVELGVSESTVRAHIDHICRKIGRRGRKSQIVVRYYTRNYL
jgi:DNA-binding CsgD family transcriptional regulator